MARPGSGFRPVGANLMDGEKSDALEGATLPYRTVILHSILLGLGTGLFGIAFLSAVEALANAIWGDDWVEPGWFSGSLWMLIVPIIAGLLVGLVYRGFRLPARYPGFIEDLKSGEVDPESTPGAIGVAIISLISGPSVGPESPLGAAGGAAGTWLARRRGADTDGVRQMSFIGISGAFGGLLSMPIGGPLMAFEMEHDQTNNYYFTNLVPGVVAGSVSFGIMWPVVGAPFEGLLSIPQDAFESWMLLAAAGLGILGAIAAMVAGRVMLTLVNLLRPFDDRPVLRGLMGGAVVGVIAFTMPLTMFSGQTTLPIVLDNFEEFGVPVLLALGLLKAAALGASLGGGFFGGPIFPMFFIGGVLGVAVHLLIPAIPLAVAVGSIMAALGAAIAFLPLSMAILTAVLIQSGLEVFGAVALASVTAYAIRVATMRKATSSDIQAATANN